MQYKLLALDIDGTIVKPDTNTPTQSVIAAIKKLRKSVHISLVSARAWKEQKIIVDMLGLENFYHVTENGTKVVNSQGTLEYNLHIPTNEVQRIIDVASELFNDVGFCIDGRWAKEYKDPQNDIIATISLISHKREHANKIPYTLQHLPKTYSIAVGTHWSEPSWGLTLISHKDASKGSGLKYIQKKLRIPQTATLAVGDGVSDISLMHHAGKKVAMGNAESELKEVADYIAPSVSEDGLVDVIEKFFFQ